MQIKIQVQKEGLNGLESAYLRRVTGLVSKSESELSWDIETLEKTFKVLDDVTCVELRITKM